MKIKNTMLLYIILCASITMIVSSCSTSHRGSHSRYSTSSKRKVNGTQTVEDKKYVYTTKTNKKTSSQNTTLTPLSMRDEVVMTAIKYAGRPYRSSGKTPDSGFDCSGFTSFVFSQNGIAISGPSDEQAKLGRHKDKENLLPGDLAFFGNEERISHVAIVASHKQNDIEVIHSTTSAGVKIDNITQSDYWSSRFLFGVDVIQK